MMTERDEQPKRIAYLPTQSTDFVVRVGGRELPWLSRLVGAVLAPIFRWRMRRGWRPGREP